MSSTTNPLADLTGGAGGSEEAGMAGGRLGSGVFGVFGTEVMVLLSLRGVATVDTISAGG